MCLNCAVFSHPGIHHILVLCKHLIPQIFPSKVSDAPQHDFFCRHVCEANTAQLDGAGDVQVQNFHPPRAAEPCVQGDVRVPGCPVPAVGRDAHPVRVQQAQHEAERDDRLDLLRAQQLGRRRAQSLD